MLCALAGTSYSRIPFGAQRHRHHCGHFPLSRSLLPSWNATLGALCSRQLCHTRSLTVANVCLWLASLNHRDVLGSPRGSDGVPTWRPATQGQAQDHGSHAPAAKHARVRVDPLRVSSAVRDNLERDGEGGAGGKYSRAEAGGGEATGARLRASVKANGDVSLGDTDRELNFALQQARAALAATSGDGDGGDDDGEDEGEGEGAPGYDSGDEDEAGGGKAGEGDEGVWQPRSSPTMRAVTADGVSRQRQRPGAGAGSGAGAASDGMQPARPPGTAPGVFGGAATSKGDSGRRAAFDEDGVSTESADYWENLLATLPDGGAQSATIDQVRVVGCCLARFCVLTQGTWWDVRVVPDSAAPVRRRGILYRVQPVYRGGGGTTGEDAAAAVRRAARRQGGSTGPAAVGGPPEPGDHRLGIRQPHARPLGGVVLLLHPGPVCCHGQLHRQLVVDGAVRAHAGPAEVPRAHTCARGVGDGCCSAPRHFYLRQPPKRSCTCATAAVPLLP